MEFELSKREIEVIELLADGYTKEEIAQELFISFFTVKNHVTRILDKYCANKTIVAVAQYMYDKGVADGKG